MKNKRLARDFFNRPTLEVAKDLLGKFLIKDDKVVQITETEAYIGEVDPACHAHRGITPRTKVMFGPPGFSYVYFIYGMYFCFNIVTEPENCGSAVLIRGAKIISGLAEHIKLDGPGKFCRALEITKEENGIDLCASKNFYLEDRGFKVENFRTTRRIGIKQAKNLPWRFILD